jgi:exosome complex RNA-binding protein Rrp42 (RNase PH superfamily)
LLHFRRPDVAVVGHKVMVYSMDDRQPVPLAIHHIPISLTFGLFKIDHKEYCMLDPSLKEEACADGLVTFTLNKHHEICCIQKAGGVAVSVDMMLRFTHTHTHTHIHIHACTRTYGHTHTYAQIYAHAHMDAHTHTFTHSR